MPIFKVFSNNGVETDNKTAIILCIDTKEDYQYYLEKINAVPIGIDVFMIVHDLQYNCIPEGIGRKYEVIISSNDSVNYIPDDILAIMKDYEYVCYLRDSKTISEKYYGVYNYSSQKSLRNCIWQNLVGNSGFINEIINYLSNNNYVGLLYPPCPSHDCYREIDKEKWKLIMCINSRS